MQKRWALCTESWKVLSHGTGRDAEGVETNEMESLQSKFVFFLFIWLNGLWEKKKRFPQANNDVIQRFEKEFAGEEMMLE